MAGDWSRIPVDNIRDQVDDSKSKVEVVMHALQAQFIRGMDIWTQRRVGT